MLSGEIDNNLAKNTHTFMKERHKINGGIYYERNYYY